MILLIDIGNTRIKWAALSQGRIGQQSAIAHEGLTREQLHAAMLATAPSAQRVLASNVGGTRVGELIADCIRSEWRIEVEFVQSSASAGGVRNAYRDPRKLGVDRWLAMIGAHAVESGPVCVVSVGTAMTIDAVDADGRHHGGVIVPGPQLMVASLFSNTSEIARRAEQGDSTLALFADNTLGAVEQGATHALAALAERAVETFGRETGQPSALMLSGGAAARVASAVSLPYRIVPDLVLRGLAVLADAPPL